MSNVVNLEAVPIDYGRYNVHPAANEFPLIIGEEFDELVDDIRAHGLYEPVIVLGDQLLDGRNRYRACVRAGVKINFKEFDGDTSETGILDFIVSSNLRRRHLTLGQKAMIAAAFVPLYAAAAKERMREGSSEGGRKSGEVRRKERVPSIEGTLHDRSGRTARIVADKHKVSHSSISKAVMVKKANPKLANEVRTGRKSLNAAYISIAKKEQPKIKTIVFTSDQKEFLRKEFRPIMIKLKKEGLKNMATMSPASVAYEAGKIQNFLRKYCGGDE